MIDLSANGGSGMSLLILFISNKCIDLIINAKRKSQFIAKYHSSRPYINRFYFVVAKHCQESPSTAPIYVGD